MLTRISAKFRAAWVKQLRPDKNSPRGEYMLRGAKVFSCVFVLLIVFWSLIFSAIFITKHLAHPEASFMYKAVILMIGGALGCFISLILGKLLISRIVNTIDHQVQRHDHDEQQAQALRRRQALHDLVPARKDPAAPPPRM